ncbi:hypothetical protein AEST_14040 [Alishewanella aestuarii B11]|uniref:Lipopolysaccharide biosynthesis protein n=1 Tax=Alishewanella aestuarii B11 TaxID=1197174 RepID=J2IG47_9ALTE|nr:O-antigen translocase [Alishewanella aestuarii]EJI85739.1 hypothetical protein AEST_14040 [Alishewanella aestuarii B11]
MNLARTSLLSFIATIIKMLSALIINKALAVIVGPSGLAFVAQFQSFIQISQAIGQCAINNGITRYTAEYATDKENLRKIISTALCLSLISSIITGVLIVIISKYLSIYFLKSTDYTSIVALFGFFLAFFVLNNFLLSILNGLKEIGLWVKINITQSVVSLLLTLLLITGFGLKGALLSIVLTQSLVLFLAIFYIYNHAVINRDILTINFYFPEFKKLSSYILMGLTTAIIVPLSHVILRESIVLRLDWVAAGNWQAIWYISSMYLGLISTVIGVYYLPRISEIKDFKTLVNELANGYKILVPFMFILCLCIFHLREFIISILFSDSFSKVADLFMWQLIGDFIKMMSWLIAYIMIAKSLVRSFIFSEIFFSMTFCVITFYLIPIHGLVGVTIAYALNYTLYFLFVAVAVYINRENMFSNLRENNN